MSDVLDIFLKKLKSRKHWMRRVPNYSWKDTVSSVRLSSWRKSTHKFCICSIVFWVANFQWTLFLNLSNIIWETLVVEFQYLMHMLFTIVKLIGKIWLISGRALCKQEWKCILFGDTFPSVSFLDGTPWYLRSSWLALAYYCTDFAPQNLTNPTDGVCHRKQETQHAFYVYTEISLDQLRMITTRIRKVGDLNTKTEIEKDIVESGTSRKKKSHLLKRTSKTEK